MLLCFAGIRNPVCNSISLMQALTLRAKGVHPEVADGKALSPGPTTAPELRSAEACAAALASEMIAPPPLMSRSSSVLSDHCFQASAPVVSGLVVNRTPIPSRVLRRSSPFVKNLNESTPPDTTLPVRLLIAYNVKANPASIPELELPVDSRELSRREFIPFLMATSAVSCTCILNSMMLVSGRK